MKTDRTILLTRAASILMLVAFVMFGSTSSLAQPANDTPNRYDAPSRVKTPQEYIKSIDDLLHERLEQERAKYGNVLEPDLLRLEANYVRTDAPTGEIVLHEASFHLEPHYMSFSPEGITKDSVPISNQSVMYFTGSARTPLALPLVSNLSKIGDLASYTVYLGILPLPKPRNSKNDSVSYYVVIERAVESNRTEDEKKFERYAKEFTTRPGEPIRLSLENVANDNHYIFKIDDNETLNFYEDFARHIKEDILLNGEKLNFNLGKAEISSISSKLSVKYTLAKTCAVKLDLLSVVDPAHPLTLIDSVMYPADYLAEHDMKPNLNGTYQYHLTAKEVGTGKILFDETKSFEKKSAMIVSNAMPLEKDTLEVGGKKESAQKLLQAMNVARTVAETRNIQLTATLDKERDEKAELQKRLAANQSDVIAGLRGRVGMGFLGVSNGVNLFVGIESTVPSLTLDLSYGLLYSTNVPYLAYDAPQNFSQIFSSPKSLGLQFGWSPISLLNGVIQPVIRLGYYGIYSAQSATTQGGIHSATLLAPSIGLMTTPGGLGTSLGIDITGGPIFGLGINSPAQFDLQVKFYYLF